MRGVTAESMAATIETNLREMVAITRNARDLVQRVSKESIATAGNHGNGSGHPEVGFATNGNGHGNGNGNGNGKNGFGHPEVEFATNGNGHGSGDGGGGSWSSRLKQFAGVVEEEI